MSKLPAEAIVLRQHNTQHLSCGDKSRARIQPQAEGTVAFAHWLGGNCMGENLILFSCGAAFITGLVITAASIFG